MNTLLIRRQTVILLLLGLGSIIPTTFAGYIGGEPPECTCPPCECPPRKAGNRAEISLTEGNLKEPLPALAGSVAHTLDLRLTYNSYNADVSHARLDTMMGYGWTHSYNSFLFTQAGSMFLMGADGRTEKFQVGADGTYTADPGYFNKLIKNPDGSFTLTEKDQTVSQFALVPGTPFTVGGPVYRLLSINDRNNNTTSLTYIAGDLTRITDTYGRFLTLTYNSHHLAQVIDPLMRTTTFTYDGPPGGRVLARVTDPNLKPLLYTYNTLDQMVSRTDRDGRRFTFQYQNNLPVGMKDSTSSNIFSLTNSSNWATSFPDLARYQERVYVPSTTRKRDGLGNLWRYQYDANGYVTKVIAPDGAATSYSYDPATRRIATMTDANLHSTSYQYDTQGNCIKITDALNHVTTFTYEPTFSMMTSMTDPKNRVTTYDYDSHGNRTRETQAVGLPQERTRTWTYDSHGNVLTETDWRGNTTTYTYDAFGNRDTITAPPPLSYITRMTYDDVGNLKTRTDPNNHTTTYDYDGLNRLIQKTDPAEKIEQYAYDGEGHRITVTDCNRNATLFQYDQRERLIKTTDALAHFDTYSYDGNNNRTATTDRNGHPTSFTYDVQNRLTNTTDALGNVTTITYDPAGNRLTQTDANNHTTSYAYDPLNRRVTITAPPPLSYVTQFEYDTGGHPGCFPCGVTPGSSLITKQTDGNLKVIYFKYDELDRLIKVVRKEGDTADVIDPSDAVTSYTYDRNNNQRTMREPDRNTTTYQYDIINRRKTESNAAGDTTRFTYDGANNVRTVTAPNGNVTTNTYDALDRVIQVDDSIGRVINYTYDCVGNRGSQTDGNNNTTGYTYDAINRLTVVTDPLAQTTTTQYDAVGNVLKVTDREGKMTMHGYDNINRRLSTTDALNHTTQFQYDGVGNLTRIIDTKGHATQYDYDVINRLIREQYPDPAPNARTYTYDAVNMISRTDQKGQTTTYTYNDLYFLLQKTYPVSPADNMTYDLSGRLLTAERGGWLVTFTYDGANRVTQTTQNSKTIGYGYNIPGRTRMLSYPGGHQITEHTDARTRLDHIDDASSPPPIVQYNYDVGNRVVTRAYRNGTVSTYTYNPNNWITSLEHTNGATRVAGFGYDFDNEGNRKFEENRHDTTRSEGYQYDGIYRLGDYKVGTLVGSSIPDPTTETRYNLDPVGNWNRKVDVVNAVTEIRTHNHVNEITSIKDDGGPVVPILSDDNGNLQNDGTYTYDYDEENRLTKVTRNSDSAVVGQYQYDALSRRVQKIANPAGGPSTIRYYHDDARVIEEQDAGGATQATHVYGNYIDEVLTMNRGGQTYYYHQNSLWSVEAITDVTGAAVERYSYDAYGQASVFTGSGTPIPPNAWGTPHSAIGNSYTFTGRQLDEESGLYFYRARYYDAAKGRFVQRDPVRYVDGMNLYAAYFVPNATDPFGLAVDVPCCCSIDDWLARHKKVMAKLIDMKQRWHAGQIWTDYGLGDLATASGARSRSYQNAPQCIKDAIDKEEGSYGLTVLALSQMFLVGSEGYWNPIEWVFSKPGYAQGNFWLVWIASEIERRAYFGGLLKEIKDECVLKYPGCCGAVWQAWHCIDQSPRQLHSCPYPKDKDKEPTLPTPPVQTGVALI